MFNIYSNCKKAVSPLIVIILLIVVAVVLVTILLNFGKNLTVNSLNKTNNIDYVSNISSSLIFVNKIISDSVHNKIIIENRSSKDNFNFISYKIIDDDSNYFLNSLELDVNEGSVSLEPGQIYGLDIPCFPSKSFLVLLKTENQKYVKLKINISNYNKNNYCYLFENCSSAYDYLENPMDGVYLINQSGNNERDNSYYVYCDMTTSGGGWTLAMQTSSSSNYTFENEVWTNTSGGSKFAGDPSIDQDYVSKAFYNLEVSESRLAMNDLSNWNSWYHEKDTPRNLSNQPTMASSMNAVDICLANMNCGVEPINVIPEGLNNATSGTLSDSYHRFGYVNVNNSWGPDIRVGFSGDGDSSDSSDTVIGIGLRCNDHCPYCCVTSGAHNTGSGYYFYPNWANIPLDGNLKGWLWIR